MSTKDLYTPQQVSEMLRIPPSSLRRYASDWSGYLSDSAKQSGKKRYYNSSDVQILGKIADLTRRRTPQAEIARQLSILDTSNSNSSALAMLPAVMLEFDHLRGDIASLHDTDTDLERRLKALEELEEQRNKKRSWWSKLFGG